MTATFPEIVEVVVEIPRGSRNKYNLLEDKTVDVDGWADADRARTILIEDRKRFEVEG